MLAGVWPRYTRQDMYACLQLHAIYSKSINQEQSIFYLFYQGSILKQGIMGSLSLLRMKGAAWCADIIILYMYPEVMQEHKPAHVTTGQCCFIATHSICLCWNWHCNSVSMCLSSQTTNCCMLTFSCTVFPQSIAAHNSPDICSRRRHAL